MSLVLGLIKANGFGRYVPDEGTYTKLNRSWVMDVSVGFIFYLDQLLHLSKF